MFENQKIVCTKCPKCGACEPLFADGYNVERCTAFVVVDTATLSMPHPDITIDWDNLTVEADFVYRCPSCNEILFHDMNEIREAIRNKDPRVELTDE